MQESFVQGSSVQGSAVQESSQESSVQRSSVQGSLRFCMAFSIKHNKTNKRTLRGVFRSNLWLDFPGKCMGFGRAA